jgi:hypothetical protein
MDASVKLNDASVEAALQAAVLAALGEVGREAIVKTALAEITRSSLGPGGRKEGPLYDVIRTVTYSIATKVIEEKLRADVEFLGFVESVYLHGLRKFMLTDRDKLVEAVSGKMSEAMLGAGR